ncbi:MAG: PqqD family protein [Bacteroidales bacterium]|nr:PqqD family protein [Bacteroidales bacterium]
MRINEQMKVRSVVGENIVIMPAAGKVDMTKVVALNESALHLYNSLAGRPFELSDAVEALLREYDVDEATARRDAEAWIAEMRENGLITD